MHSAPRDTRILGKRICGLAQQMAMLMSLCSSAKSSASTSANWGTLVETPKRELKLNKYLLSPGNPALDPMKSHSLIDPKGTGVTEHLLHHVSAGGRTNQLINGQSCAEAGDPGCGVAGIL